MGVDHRPEAGQKKAKIKPVATGLWSRYGNPIIAPDEFLNQLPCCLLDGELFAGRGNFQLCRSICGGDTPDPRFMAKIIYAVFQPAAVQRLCHRRHQEFQFPPGDGFPRLRAVGPSAAPGFRSFPASAQATSLPTVRRHLLDEIRFLHENLDNIDPDSKCYLHRQTKLSDDPVEAAQTGGRALQKVLDLGGEGVVVRDPQATWIPKRHRGLLKYKPFHDAEARITGFTSGRETDKGSKHLGRIGEVYHCLRQPTP